MFITVSANVGGRNRINLRIRHLFSFHSVLAQSNCISTVYCCNREHWFALQEITTESIQENATRRMTVICAEESEFLVLDKEDYVNNGLDVLQQQESQVRLEFFMYTQKAGIHYILIITDRISDGGNAIASVCLHVRYVCRPSVCFHSIFGTN